ncbi:Elongation factor Tu GTP binding domain [seawater metagenome]|uniref:Elongation factor Tu GTP binding domain n=1 Tax=seawater metagenome TaxID=1561972 RepID=A0A5E8CLY0_9ZZZZ
MSKKLPPEVEEGNIEYKRKLCGLTKYRNIQLQSQMKWRIQEGNGCAIYLIGVDDDGSIVKLNTKDRKESLRNIKKIAKNIDAFVENIEFKSNYYEITIKNNFKNIDFYEKRIVFLGESNVGKSTLISVMTKNISDDGNGSARLALFNHKHEMFTGVTSSISIQYFDYKDSSKVNTKEYKIVLIDLPGNKKYKKTKYFGLQGLDPELVVYVIDNNTPLNKIKECINLTKFLKLPLLIVLNKVDLYDTSSIKRKIQNCDFIETSCTQNFNITELQHKFIKDNINTSSNLDYEIDDSSSLLSQILLEDDIIFQIYEVYHLTDLGLIVSGIQLAGEIKDKMKVKLGPLYTKNGPKFVDVNVTSIHSYEIPCNILHTDHLGTMVIQFKDNEAQKEFTSKMPKSIYLCNYILPLYDHIKCQLTLTNHVTNLKVGQQIQIFTRNLIIECILIDIENGKIIKKNETNIVTLRLAKQCYLRTLDKFIFDDGIIKGWGVIYKLTINSASGTG